MLQFTAVDFAETYEVVFDGVMVVLKNDGKKGGESIEYILSEDETLSLFWQFRAITQSQLLQKAVWRVSTPVKKLMQNLMQ